MSRGRRQLLATLQLTTTYAMAARCRFAYATRLSDWANGHRLPSAAARVALEREYRIPTTSWDEPYVRDTRH